MATKKAVKKVTKKKVTKKPVKAPEEKKGMDTPVEPPKPVKTPSEGIQDKPRRYKARPKALSPVDNRKVPSSYAKSRSSKRHPNIIG